MKVEIILLRENKMCYFNVKDAGVNRKRKLLFVVVCLAKTNNHATRGLQGHKTSTTPKSYEISNCC